MQDIEHNEMSCGITVAQMQHNIHVNCYNSKCLPIKY